MTIDRSEEKVNRLDLYIRFHVLDQTYARLVSQAFSPPETIYYLGTPIVGSGAIIRALASVLSLIIRVVFRLSLPLTPPIDQALYQHIHSSPTL